MPYKDPEKKRAYMKRFVISHKKELDKYHRQYRKKHREKSRLYAIGWKKKNPNYDRDWQKENRDKKSKNQKKWQSKNLDKCRAQQARRRTKQKGGGGSFTTEEFGLLCRSYSNRCLCCHKKRKLSPDHVVPVSKGGSSNIDNIQPLCIPCNSSKGDRAIDYRKARCLR